jgi:hypothetical protein
MAPSNLHESKYPRTTMAAATTTHSTSGIYTTITVGRSSHAIDLLVPKAPPVQASQEAKSQVFDFLQDLLLEHRLLYSSAELIAAFNHIPCNSYNAV